MKKMLTVEINALLVWNKEKLRSSLLFFPTKHFSENILLLQLWQPSVFLMFIVLTTEMQEYVNNHTMYRTEMFLTWYCALFTSLHNYLASAWNNKVRDYNE